MLGLQVDQPQPAHPAAGWIVFSIKKFDMFDPRIENFQVMIMYNQ